MTTDLDALELLTRRVIGCAIDVHRELGPGLLESVYSECLTLELVANDLAVERERQVPIVFRGETIRSKLRIDLIVDGQIVVEVKAVERSNPIYIAQLVTYLKMTGLPAGLLLNFNAGTLKAGLKRASHPSIHALRAKRPQDGRRGVRPMDLRVFDETS